MMNEIDYRQDCGLVSYLLVVSSSDMGGHVSQIAGVLLSALGYPLFSQSLHDMNFIEELVQFSAGNKQTNLLHESAEKCVNCRHSDYCQLGAIFKRS